METDAAVSELVGTILLISLVVIAASIVAVAILSQPIPEDVPQLTAIAENQSQTVYLLHTGGDSLQENEIKTIVNGQDSPFSLDENENWPWSAGKLLKVDYPGQGMPEYVQLIYTGGSTQTLILTTYFVPADVFGAPPTIPPTLPTSIPTTIITTLPTTIPTPENGGCSDVIANFNANPITGDIPLLVTFTDTSSSVDPITNRTWNFGDGNVTITSNPTISHAYTSVGSYTVTLFVANVCGNSNSTTIPNLIVTSCPPVTANFTGSPTSGEIPLTVLFTDTSVSGAPITSRTWNFGDGNVTTTSNPTISHIYILPGPYTVTLNVENSCGNSQSIIKSNYISATYSASGAVINLTKNCGSTGYMLDGTYYQFTAKNGDKLKIGGTTYNLNNNDVVQLVINGNQSIGSILMNHPNIQKFAFNVKFYKNSILIASGVVEEIDCQANKNKDISTLTYILDPSCSAYTHLTIDGDDVINKIDSSRIQISNMKIIHDNSVPFGNMFIVNLDGSHNQINSESDIVVY